MCKLTNEHRPRNSLTKDQALAIFKRRPNCFRQINTAALAKEFGVTAKAVRDIWIGRTWYKDTLYLEPSRIDAVERLTRRIGRPKGSRDSKPRIRKIDAPCEDKGQYQAIGSWDDKTTSFFRDEKPHGHACFNNVDDAVFLVSCTETLFIDPFHNDWPCWSCALP